MSQQLTLDRIRADVAELLYEDPGDVDDTADLLASGLDSVRILTLVERWREAGVQVSFVELAESPTLAAWWMLLKPRLPGAGHG
ncbi:MAG TPA: phosphopantetheine-binding protein [Streptosporangiaceae bacterium]|jgi:bifunctional isochorismate lyase/aryl carrier protein